MVEMTKSGEVTEVIVVSGKKATVTDKGTFISQRGMEVEKKAAEIYKGFVSEGFTPFVAHWGGGSWTLRPKDVEEVKPIAGLIGKLVRPSDASEAKVMAEFGEKIGIKKEHMLPLEESSTDMITHYQKGIPLLFQTFPDPTKLHVTVVADGYQVKREELTADYFLTRAGILYTVVGADTKVSKLQEPFEGLKERMLIHFYQRKFDNMGSSSVASPADGVVA